VDTASTYVIRTKEDEDDYRYFPEPDLPPFVISNEEIEAIRQTMPPLQDQKSAKVSGRIWFICLRCRATGRGH
jgi:Asp-tRNA(Asn)/Glu-tRNA(Gln) amidotransferase B subunit